MYARERGLAAGLVLLGSCLSAALAHAAAETLAGIGIGSGVASEYSHSSVMPLLVAGVAGLLSIAFRAATRGEALRRRRALLAAAARRIARFRLLPLWFATFAAGLCVLGAAEAAEQVASTGFIIPVDLLGGTAPTMLAVLACVAFVASIAARTFLSELFRCAAGACAILARRMLRPGSATLANLWGPAIQIDRRQCAALGALSRRGPPEARTI